MRVFLKIAYDGTFYHGWQSQEGQDTVQGKIEECLSLLTKSPVELIGASRTDARVHALGNVAVFDTEFSIPPDRYSYALNDMLPGDIRIIESKEVPGEFNPRFDAIKKTYEYRIYNGPILLPTERLYAYHYRGNIDVIAMNEGAKWLLGEHDFTSLSSVHAQAKTRVRTIYDCRVKREGDFVTLSVTGSGFLYNMVRIIAGTLLEVGIGRLSPKQLPAIIEAKDRTKAGRTLPPEGLRLLEIEYDS